MNVLCGIRALGEAPKGGALSRLGNPRLPLRQPPSGVSMALASQALGWGADQ